MTAIVKVAQVSGFNVGAVPGGRSLREIESNSNREIIVSKSTSFQPAIAADGALHRLKQLGAVVAGTLVLALSSYVTVPMIPVPITLQTLAVVLVGAFYGWRLGGITIAAWLMEGALGLPVFAGGTGGLLVFLGPTAGYLLSFPLIGALAGWLVEHGWNGAHPIRAFWAMMLAQTVCLLLGAAWLAVLIGPKSAFLTGVLPFIPGEIVKSALAAATLASWHAAKRYTGRR